METFFHTLEYIVKYDPLVAYCAVLVTPMSPVSLLWESEALWAEAE